MSRDIDPALVEKAARIIDPADAYAGRGRARAVLAAVLPDVRRAPVVDREALAEALWSDQNDDPDLLWENVYTDEYHRRADNLIAEMDWQDAADVRREVAAETLTEAADAWQRGQWANVPRCRDRVQERIANGQYVTDWLRNRAALASPDHTEEPPHPPPSSDEARWMPDDDPCTCGPGEACARDDCAGTPRDTSITGAALIRRQALRVLDLPHTQAHTDRRGGGRIPYCVECSEAAQEWVSWPCPGIAREAGGRDE